MIGSPNYVQMVYDADQSTFPAPVAIPDGSVAIEDLYESFYTKVGEPYDDTAFDGRSDYQAFIDNGIAAGGLFTGAEEVKTDQQAQIWGGTAGEAFDPCYHQACDKYGNVEPARAGGQQRPRRLRPAHLRLLDRGRERCARPSGPGPAVAPPHAGGA